MNMSSAIAIIIAAPLFLFHCSEGKFSGSTGAAVDQSGGKQGIDIDKDGIPDVDENGNPITNEADGLPGGAGGNSGGGTAGSSDGGDSAGGNTGGNGGPSGSRGGDPDNAEGGDSDCSGEFVDLEFPDYVKACHDKGVMYNFNASAKGCASLSLNQEMCSDYDTIVETLKSIDETTHLIGSLENKREQDFVIVACGKSADNSVVVAQVMRRERLAGCTARNGLSVLTLCHRSGGDSKDLSGASEAEKERVVNECMSLK